MDIFNQLLNFILKLLPKSPFQAFIKEIGNIPYLSIVNWFIPVSEMIAVFEAFLAVVAVYYVYMAIMRHINMIK